MGLVGLAVFAVAGIAAAQVAASAQVTGADRVLLLQAKRFEGSFKFSGGDTEIKLTDNSADWTINSGTTKYTAALAPKAGKPDRATFQLDGKTIEGKAEIEGKTLSFEFTVDKTKYVFKLTLSGRNEGDLSVKKGDTALVTGTLKRA
jgi:hypothetical protein